MPAEDESLRDRVAALEETVADLSERLDTTVNRDIPLLKGTVRTLVDDDIEEIEALPDAGRAFNQRIESHEDRLTTIERQLAAIGDVQTQKTTKEQKLAGICAFAQNKTDGRSATVAVTADEIQGCVGVSRRYAYDLIEEAAATMDGIQLREAKSVQTSTGVKHKKKAALVDCEQVHANGAGVNQFTTRTTRGEGRATAERETGVNE